MAMDIRISQADECSNPTPSPRRRDYFTADPIALCLLRMMANNCILCAVTRQSSIVSRTEADIGTQCRLFNIEKIGDDSPMSTSPSSPSATDRRHARCTMSLREPFKGIHNEINRNLVDPMVVARNTIFNLPLRSWRRRDRDNR
ncbi:hypothetical protein DFH11DRAFT_1732430 [Phellopilus nigrolimitatus]|nr:hypothetical protein DFH11DRAFT_1732430 [Phellopilus nigrolimitatus]